MIRRLRRIYKLIRDQGTDLVIAYEPGESVKKRLKEEGDNLIIKPIGRDALVFMANQGNPVNSLTGRQVIDIYSGNITNWKTVGGRQPGHTGVSEACGLRQPESDGEAGDEGNCHGGGTAGLRGFGDG